MADLLRLNDWPLKKFFTVYFILLLSFLGTVALNFLGFKIPILRELTGFLFLTFIPGLLLLRILKLHDLHTLESVLYSIGSSLSIIMLLGLFVNLTYPSFGIQKPLSTYPLIVTIVTFTLALCIICYTRDKDFSPSDLNVSQQLPLYVLSLLLIPFLSIFGAYVMNIYDNNTLILMLLFIISLFPVLITLDKIPEELHGLAIFVASISILFHVNLVSWHLWGWDVHLLAYSSNLVREKLYWDPNIVSPGNDLLLITILPTVYSVITGLNIVWVFKLFFPFFFSLVPLGIYVICKNEFDNKLIPALAPFPFMFYYACFKTLPSKQMVSELFLVLLVMLVVNKRIPNLSRKALAIAFSFSLIVSHYGVSYFFMLVLTLAILFSFLSRLKNEFDIIKPSFGILYFVFAASWFMFVSGGYHFDAIIKLGYNIITNLTEILYSPEARSGFRYAIRQMPTLMWSIYKYLNYMLQIFIALGILKLLTSLIKRKKMCRSGNFAVLSIGFYGFLASSIIISFGMGFDRTLQITFVLLAPYAVIGCIYFFELLAKGLKLLQRIPTICPNPSLTFFGAFLAIYFLFSSGFAFQVMGEATPPYCIALDKDNWERWNTYYMSEVAGAEWIKNHNPVKKVSTLPGPKWTSKDTVLLAEYYIHVKDFIYFDPNITFLPSHLCIYLGNMATKKGKIPYWAENKLKFLDLKKSNFYQKVLIKSNKVFDSGRSWVYYVP